MLRSLILLTLFSLSTGQFGVALSTTPNYIAQKMLGNVNWQFGTTTGILSPNLTSLVLTDILHGAAVGPNGAIFQTSFGGSSWISLSSPTINDLHGITTVVASPWIFYAVGAQGTVIKSTDLAQTWSLINASFTGANFNAAQWSLKDTVFTDEQTGWVIGSYNSVSYILKTTNGGVIWTTLTNSSSSL